MSAGVDGQVLKGGGRLAAYANFVKIAHTVFALPFAVVGMTLALRTNPLDWRKVALAVLAFGAARFAAMGFNRIVDLRYDARNPRTAMRELPAGRMSVKEAWALVAGMTLLFLACCSLLNPLCLALAPVALLWFTSYSYAKRFTPLCHLWLGLAMAIAPAGGYLAITGAWSTPWYMLPLFGLAVASWGAGFDVVYSLQDEEFDRVNGLKSLTVSLGAGRAILVARLLHVLAVASLAALGVVARLGWPYGLAVALAAGLLIYEHRLVREGDYSRLDAAFFTMNGVISGVVMLGAVADALR
ncbi:MAG: UbiA-like polyprenyltransferase [Gemmatimonadales bacterium]